MIEKLLELDKNGTLSCLLVIGMFAFAWWSVSGGKKRERYQKPRVTGARVVTGNLYHFDEPSRLGELDVESSHSEHVVRELELPASSVVSIVQKNKKYSVRFTLPPKTTPDSWDADVWDSAGNKSVVKMTYTQRQADRDRVREWARANGYDGEVEE